jgi:hypothetical protein
MTTCFLFLDSFLDQNKRVKAKGDLIHFCLYPFLLYIKQSVVVSLILYPLILHPQKAFCLSPFAFNPSPTIQLK